MDCVLQSVLVGPVMYRKIMRKESGADQDSSL